MRRNFKTMDYLSGWCSSYRRLEGRTVIVTGCNTGIGKETALDMYKRGARVIMACRNMSKAESAKQDIEHSTRIDTDTGSLVVEQLDLCSMASVRAFADRVTESEHGIYALINNAGVMMCPESRTEDGFETHIGSNHLGHALLTLLLLPVMIGHAPARIVFVSSYVHSKYNLDLDDFNFEKKKYNAFEAYCRSKAANIMFAKALADKLKERNISNVKTYSVHPGVISTEISRHFDETAWSGARFLFNGLGYFLKSPRCGAQTTIYCAVDDACADQSGLYYCECAPKSPSKQCRDGAAVAKLWDLTIKAVNLHHYDPFSVKVSKDQV